MNGPYGLGKDPQNPDRPLILVSDQLEAQNFLSNNNNGTPSKEMPEMDYYLQVVATPEAAWHQTSTRYLLLCFGVQHCEFSAVALKNRSPSEVVTAFATELFKNNAPAGRFMMSSDPIFDDKQWLFFEKIGNQRFRHENVSKFEVTTICSP